MRVLPRLRMLLARRPWLYWLLVGLCASAVWLAMSAAADDVATQRERWGSTRRVWVTSAAVTAGSPVVVVAGEYPQAMVPAAALMAAPDGVAAHDLAAGEVVVQGDLAGPGGVGPADWLVFAVPAEGSPSLAVSDEVTVFGSGQRWCDGIVTDAATVLEVAVPPECAASVSAQLMLHAVTLARRP
jgi:hypothetical protein